MKVKDFFWFDIQLSDKFCIGLEELRLLSYVAGKWDGKEEVTITTLLDTYTKASPATTHKRLKSLIKQNLVTKTISEPDTRIKTLGEGRLYKDLVKFLKEV
jgi:DNA-binding MarR family transcriptional regulator